MSFSDQAMQIRNWLAKKQPEMAKLMMRTNRVLQIIGEKSDSGKTKAAGLVFNELANLIMKWNTKRAATAQAELAEVKDVDELSPEALELLDFLAVSKEAFEERLAEGVAEIRAELAELKVKINEILDTVTKQYHANMNVYTDMLESEGNLDEWALNFHNNLGNFREVLGDFEKTNVTEYLKKVYKHKCSTDMDAMYETFGFILHARSLFTLLLVTYYSNIPKVVLDKLPTLDPVQRSLKEIEASDIAVKSICEAANDALNGFFMAALTSDPTWNLQLRFVPEFEELPKTSDTFWKNTTYQRLQNGSYFGSLELKAYTLEGTNFIKCQDKDNNEYIYNLGDDKKLIKQGTIFRGRGNNGYTGIGSRYFSRSGREEDRVYRLHRYSKSGNIEYYDGIKGKDDKDRRVLAMYSFNTETLNWGENLVAN